MSDEKQPVKDEFLSDMSTFLDVDRKIGQDAIRFNQEEVIRDRMNTLITLVRQSGVQPKTEIIEAATQSFSRQLESIQSRQQTPSARFTQKTFNAGVIKDIEAVDLDDIIRRSALRIKMKDLRAHAGSPNGTLAATAKTAISWLESRDWKPVPLNAINLLFTDTVKRAQREVVRNVVPLEMVSLSVGAVSVGKFDKPKFMARVGTLRDAYHEDLVLKQDLLRFKVRVRMDDLHDRLEKTIRRHVSQDVEQVVARGHRVLRDKIAVIDREHKTPGVLFHGSTWNQSILEDLKPSFSKNGTAINVDNIALQAAIFAHSRKIEELSRTGDTIQERQAARLALTWLDFQNNEAIPLKAMAMHMERTLNRARTEIARSSIGAESSQPSMS